MKLGVKIIQFGWVGGPSGRSEQKGSFEVIWGPMLPGLRYNKSQGPGGKRDSLKYITWPWQIKSQS